MTLGKASVGSNLSYSSRVDSPDGWLLNPQSIFLILFEKFKKSARAILKSIPISSTQNILESVEDLKTQDFIIYTVRLKHGTN